MTPPALESILLLMETYRQWSHGAAVDWAHIEALHNTIVCANHTAHLQHDSAYSRLARELGLAEEASAVAIRSHLTVSVSIFKAPAYDPRGRFTPARLHRWLQDLTGHPPPPALAAHATLTDWLTGLEAAHDVQIAVSSGTGGHSSLVPRSQWTRQLGQLAADIRLRAIFASSPLSTLDALLLAPSDGRQGFVGFAQGIGRLARSSAGLLPGQGLAPIIARLQALARAERDVVLVSTPTMLLTLCQTLAASGQLLPLSPRSLLLLGGGWKSTPSNQQRDQHLRALVLERLHIPAERIDEAYSMVECNASMPRCAVGRYHIPPLLWPAVVDDGLSNPRAEGRGRFAFHDALWCGTPGVLASTDLVNLTRQPCPCGRSGWSIVGPIQRAPRSTKAGCGRAMAAPA